LLPFTDVTRNDVTSKGNHKDGNRKNDSAIQFSRNVVEYDFDYKDINLFVPKDTIILIQ